MSPQVAYLYVFPLQLIILFKNQCSISSSVNLSPTDLIISNCQTTKYKVHTLCHDAAAVFFPKIQPTTIYQIECTSDKKLGQKTVKEQPEHKSKPSSELSTLENPCRHSLSMNFSFLNVLFSWIYLLTLEGGQLGTSCQTWLVIYAPVSLSESLVPVQYCKLSPARK